jgi:hypothetical protein
MPFPSLIKSLNELRTLLRLSLDELDFGTKTLVHLNQKEDEGFEQCRIEGGFSGLFKLNILFIFKRNFSSNFMKKQ